MKLARLGYGSKLLSATKDFSVALKLRENSGASAASVGESKVDLGLCWILSGRRRAGLALLEEGVAMMRGNQAPDGNAFLAMGLRSLERGARIAGRKDIAEAVQAERLSLANTIEAIDQARDLLWWR